MPAHLRFRSPNSALFLVLFVCVLFTGTAFAAPSITLTEKIGPPTSKILVSGSGFSANVCVDIYFDTKDEALVVTDGKGEFHDAKIYALKSAYPGKHWVSALERNDDKGDQEPFVVFTDWPQYHFDAARTGSNPYENVLNKDNVSGLRLRWASPSLKYPAISNGLVYAGSLEGNGYLYAVNMGTGATVWSYVFDSSTASGPAISGGNVYDGSIAAAGASFFAVNARNGSPIWASTCGQTYTSPALNENLVYVSSTSEIFALDQATGSTIWSYTFPVFNFTSSPAVGQGKVFGLGGDEELYAFDASTGAIVWTFPSGDLSGKYSSPAVSNGVVYIGIGKTFYALNAHNGSVLWTYPTGGTDPAIANGIVYFGSGDFLYAVNAVTGAVLWQFQATGRITSPSFANGVVYADSENTTLYALDGHSGKLLWSHKTDCCAGFDIAPAIANGWLLTGGLQAFSLGSSTLDHEDNVLAPDLKGLHPDLALSPSRQSTQSVE